MNKSDLIKWSQVISIIIIGVFLTIKYPLVIKIIYISFIPLSLLGSICNDLVQLKNANGDRKSYLAQIGIQISFLMMIVFVYFSAFKMASRANDLFDRGMLKAKQNDIPGALADYNKVIELDSKYAGAYNNRGILKAKQNDISGALADYNKVIELDPLPAHAYYNRGLLKERKLKDKKSAIQDFREAANLYRQQGDMSSERNAIDRLKELGISK